MPELPEVETTVNGIKPWILNKKIKQIKVYNPSLRWPVPEDLDKKYQSQIIVSITRRGKYILLNLQANNKPPKATIIIHLGMSGSITIETTKKALAKHDHFELITEDGTSLRYNDPRRFGCVLDSDNYQQHKLIKNLGPEPLENEFDGQYLKDKSKNKTQAVKNFIMDGKIVVGVGNIYVSEALFSAGIHPNKSASKVSLTKYNLLANVIKKVLSDAIKQGGTTLKDFVNAEGKPGYFAQSLNVYGRKNEPCNHCQKQIKQVTIGQRSTYYCGHCQK